MKKIYWRPSSVSRLELMLVASLAVGGLLAVESFLVTERQPAYETKLEAAKIARRAFEQIHVERIRLQIPIDAEMDPAMSGLIGPPMSPIVSNSGFLASKRTSVNPNFAAVVVDMLGEAGVKTGDTIAVGVSGSFPAISAAVYAAAEAMDLKPVVITSLAASQFGASHPKLTWLDMERVMFEQNITKIRSVAASRGGIRDRADGHTDEGRALLDEAASRNGIPMLEPLTYSEAVAKRLEVYSRAAENEKYRAYINVGGGTASVGTYQGKKKFSPGVNFRPPRTAELDSVMLHFAQQGLPVLHMVQIKDLAARYGLPIEPVQTPKPGQGGVYFRAEYNNTLVWIVLGLILLSLYATMRMDLGFRVLKGGGGAAQQTKPPEPMV